MSKKIPQYEHDEIFRGSRILSTRVSGPHTKRATPLKESYMYYKAEASVSTSEGGAIDGAIAKTEIISDNVEEVKLKALKKAQQLAETTI